MTTTALSLAVSLAAGAVSTSDLGVVLVGPSGSATTLLAACPRVVKAELPLTGVAAGTVLATYQQQCSGGTAIVGLADDPIAPVALTRAQGQTDAATYWALVVSAVFANAGGTPLVDPATVQWIAGPQNFFSLLPPGSGEYAAGFMERLAQLVQTEAALRGGTFRLVLPPPPSPAPAEHCAAFDAARLASSGGVAWSWRASPSSLPVPLAGSLGDVLGYTAARAACANLSGAPLFVEVSTPGGWLASNRTPGEVLDWLRALDDAADADADVHGPGAVLLRSAGGSSVDDLAAFAIDLATHLASPGTPPGGGGTTSGGTGPFGTPPTTGGGGTLGSGGHRGGCGLPAGSAAALAVVLLALRGLRVRVTRS